MKSIQEFSDDVDRLVPSADMALRKINKLPLPYTGNKKKLIHKIHDALVQNNIEFNTVLDAFSGSATVSYLFKLMGKRVISNDLLTSSYVNSVAFVENPGVSLTDEEKRFLLYNENSNKGDFVEKNYLGTQFRDTGAQCRFSKFTLKECRHLDNFRANIDELCGKYSQGLSLAANASVILRLPFGNVDLSDDIMSHRIRQGEEYGEKSVKHDRRIGIYYDKDFNLDFNKWFIKYVSDFIQGNAVDSAGLEPKIKRASFLANVQQHVLRDCMVEGRLNHGQCIAEIERRLSHRKNQLKAHWSNSGSTEMDFFTRSGTGTTEGNPGQSFKWWTFADADLPGKCLAVNMDIIDLLNSGFCNVDAAYFDPPYGASSSDYAEIYRFLEEYIYSTPLEEIPHLANNSKRFVSKKNYETNFNEMLQAAKHIPIWIFSYNDNSWKDINYIVGIINQFKSNTQVIELEKNYRYLYRSKQGRTNKSTEYLIVAR